MNVFIVSLDITKHIVHTISLENHCPSFFLCIATPKFSGEM